MFTRRASRFIAGVAKETGIEQAKKRLDNVIRKQNQ